VRALLLLPHQRPCCVLTTTTICKCFVHNPACPFLVNPRPHPPAARRGSTVSAPRCRRRRDERDSQRAGCPLAAAPDAVLLDTTALSPEEALGRALADARARLPRAGGSD